MKRRPFSQQQREAVVRWGFCLFMAAVILGLCATMIYQIVYNS